MYIICTDPHCMHSFADPHCMCSLTDRIFMSYDIQRCERLFASVLCRYRKFAIIYLQLITKLLLVLIVMLSLYLRITRLA